MGIKYFVKMQTHIILFSTNTFIKRERQREKERKYHFLFYPGHLEEG